MRVRRFYWVLLVLAGIVPFILNAISFITGNHRQHLKIIIPGPEKLDLSSLSKPREKANGSTKNLYKTPLIVD